MVAPLAQITRIMPAVTNQPIGPASSAVFDAKDGFLENVPLSWLRLFIEYQPCFLKSFIRRMLFESSKCLAKRILEIESNVTLRIDCVKSIQLTAEQAQARRSVLTDFLSVRQAFQVKLSPAGWQCFPTQLADRVTLLKIYDKGAQAPAECPWDAITNLRTVHYDCSRFALPRLLDMAGVRTLCEAVRAGQLLQLRNLHLSFWDYIDESGKIVRDFSPQIEEVIEQLTTMRCIALTGCSLTEGVMQQLCEHPTLKHVTLQGCSVKGDYSQNSCSWETLTMHGAHMETLVCLPLSGVQQIRIVGGWSTGRMSNIQAAGDMLGLHVHKWVCLPAVYGRKFTIAAPWETMTTLVERMHNVHTLQLNSAIEPQVVPLLWQSLPASVMSVEFEFSLDGAWCTALWQGIPAHVTSVHLTVCPSWTTDLSMIVRTTPAHVQEMVLTVQLDEFDTCHFAELRKLAPQHLNLMLLH